MKILVSIIVAVSTVALLTACGPASAPTEAPKAPAGKPAAPEQKPAWEQKWQTVLAAAKKEGTVSVYTTWNPAARTAVGKGFKDRHGINVEFTQFDRGNEFMARYQQEKRAGLELIDVIAAGGATTQVVMTKPAGLLGQLEPQLILPEVLDARLWRKGAVPFLDKEKQIMAVAGTSMRFMAYNTNLVKQGELSSFRDVLKPQYKGKVTLNDPSVPGAGIGFFGHLALQIWSEQEARDFLRELLRNEAVVMRDQRLQAEWLAQGKNPIGLALDPNRFAELIRVGAPIAPVIVKEGVYITTGDSAIAVPTVMPHPNAAAVFINWLLSKEGGTVFYEAAGAMSMRADVSTAGLNPNFVPGPEEKTFMDTEEYVAKRGTLMPVAKDIIAEKK